MTTKEIIEKGKTANTVKELKELAKQDEWDMSDEEANAYFEELQKYKTQSTGELSDDELDDVSGGGCHNKDGRLIVTAYHKCDRFECNCGKTRWTAYAKMKNGHCTGCYKGPACCRCKNCKYDSGLWVCTHLANVNY